jgi:hypothetical protein
VFVLSFSQKRFDALTPQQQTWVREAAKGGHAGVGRRHLRREHARPGKPAPTVPGSTGRARPKSLRCAPACGRPWTGSRPTRRAGRCCERSRRSPRRIRCPTCRGAPDLSAGRRQHRTRCDPRRHFRPARRNLPGRVTTQDVTAAGLDNSDGTSGTSTLTVRQRTYEVRCRPIKHPGTDCGHSSYGRAAT